MHPCSCVVYICVILCVKDLLFFDLVCGGSSYMPCVCLCFAAMPQVNEGFVDVQKDQWGARSQTAAVTRHFQQVALNGYLATHTVQTPIIWNGVKQSNINMLVYCLHSIPCLIIIVLETVCMDKDDYIVQTWAHYLHASKVIYGIFLFVFAFLIQYCVKTLTVWINEESKKR